jgi:adenine-specific DNA-methyltransferase
MKELPKKLHLRSHDIAEDKRQELLRLFPEIRTEGSKLDFERLKLALGESLDVGKERYGMNWPGKSECFKAIQNPSLGTLLPCPEQSVNFENTENLIIEGDNLEVLKLLQKPYLGKVKMIYIDPPYNTGNDFIYPDDFAESLQTYLEYTGQVDAAGRKFGTNSDADGRFHSKWLNMMYPRLYLARNLLCERGVVFISIDDNEIENLRRICNEIFGEENFIATVIWQKNYAPKSSARHLSEDHDYIIIYARNSTVWQPELLPRTEQQDAVYKNPDNDPRGEWRPNNLAARNYYSKGTYPIRCPGGRLIEGPPKGSYWRVSEEKFGELDREGRIWWGQDKNNVPAPKIYLSEVKQGRVPQTLWFYSDVGHTQDAKRELMEFVKFENTDNVIDSVKPSALIRRMLQIATKVDESDIVLDFFGGTGSTGHAVLVQNAEDNGNRRFILVQLPEPLTQKEKDLGTIADITKERVRRVITKLNDEDAGRLNMQGREKQDRGFRVFELAESNLEPWNAGVPHDAPALERQLELQVNHIREGRTDQDILYEVLLKSGYPLTTPVQAITLAGKPVHSVAGGQLLICLERKLTLELIRAMAQRKPERVVCLDEGFEANDQLKTNAAHIFEPTDRREAKSDAKRFRTV